MYATTPFPDNVCETLRLIRTSIVFVNQSIHVARQQGTSKTGVHAVDELSQK